MKDALSSYHPVVNFLYFAGVIVFAMVFMHPVCLTISLIFSIAYAIYLNGKKAIQFNLRYMLPMLIVTALINPAFNHEGATILTYLHSGNPLTLESITYGIAAAMMYVTVIGWFSCYNVVMTSDKFMYLFGRVIPAMSLIFAMVLRFVPRFKAQLAVVSYAQKCIGRDVSNGSVIVRVKHGIRILSIMVTWMLENAIDTADSMKSRGYGLKGRTAFSLFRFDYRDRMAVIAIGSLVGYLIAGAMVKGLHFRYFPTMRGVEFSAFSMSLFMAYAVLCAMPLMMNRWEDRKWKLSPSSM
jgi:energy-coupling factor transport system permease protein